ncbi:unnamed protein product [Clavelina lepadiformis]|uniref:Uncharacterized protein n=1 Tax=Clavelina lepadiformis TaxID=159417 RepID=A0ABP0GIQ4_CLALP
MIDVRDQLQEMYKNVSQAEIAEHVANLLPHINVLDDPFDVESWCPIDIAFSGPSGICNLLVTRPGKPMERESGLEQFIEDYEESDNQDIRQHVEKEIEDLNCLAKFMSINDMIFGQNLEDVLHVSDDLQKTLQTKSLEEKEAVKLGDDLVKSTVNLVNSEEPGERLSKDF